MLIKSTQKFIRTSPRKLRLVARATRGKTPAQALTALKFVDKRAAMPVSKVIKSAVANAKNNFKLDEANLTLAAIEINPGPTIKRGRPVSRGQYHAIKKRTSHITVTLEAK